jgi:hypothetical protein
MSRKHPEFHTIGFPEPEASMLKESAKQILKDRDESVSALRCASIPIGCGKEITSEEFSEYTALDAKEYSMSGLCLGCQNEFFGDVH